MTLRIVNFSVEALGNWDTCYHLDDGQILITTDPPFSHLSESVKESWGSKDTWIVNALKLIMTLVGANLFGSYRSSGINC